VLLLQHLGYPFFVFFVLRNAPGFVKWGAVSETKDL